MSKIEDTMGELIGSIVGLCLLYDIKTDEGTGKIIVNLLHKLEEQINRLATAIEKISKLVEGTYEALDPQALQEIRQIIKEDNQ